MKIILLTILLLLSSLSYSQLVSTILDHNNVSATVANGGVLFNNGTSPGYEVPAGSGNHGLQSLRLWYSGKDSLGNIHVNKGGIPGIGTDVFSGAYSDSNVYDQAHQNRYSTGVWSICQWEIDQYLNWWEYENGLTATPPATGIPNNYTLDKIYNWPAHGYIPNGEEYWLAPYYDYDNDGSYMPSEGDYPLIKGCCASWMVHNDADTIHSLTNQLPIGIQIKTMVYQYKTWGTYLDNTTFIDVEITNYGDYDLTEFAYGIYAEATLGNTTDNLFGSDSTTNLMYFYNQDNDDENFYGANPPAIGIVALGENAHSITKHVPNSAPSEIFNVLHGLSPNGFDYTHPDGHATKYVYSDDPNDIAGWSEYQLGNWSIDPAGILSTNRGDLDAVEINWDYYTDTLRQTYAIIYEGGGDHLQNVTNLINRAAEVKNFYDNDSDIPCAGWTWNVDELNPLDDMTIYPNPSTGIFNITNANMERLNVTVLDLAGKIVYQTFDETKEIRVELNTVPAGIYVVKVANDTNVLTKKLVIE